MLHFNGLEPIDFKGKLYEPKIDAEKRLRLSDIKFNTEEERIDADSVLASCFEEEEAKNFIRDKLSIQDKQVLATYLAGGETGLNRLSEITNGTIEKYIEDALSDKILRNELKNGQKVFVDLDNDQLKFSVE